MKENKADHIFMSYKNVQHLFKNVDVILYPYKYFNNFIKLYCFLLFQGQFKYTISNQISQRKKI